MTTAWGVDSYHIAVGAGDAAIHLLIKNPGQTGATIERAILVDGGDDYGGITDNVRWTMKSIAAKYGPSTNPPPLKFDAIVISHWDEDHYLGIVNLIEEDIETQTTPNVDSYQISFMKYDGQGRTKPLTYLYAPYFMSKKKNKTSYNGKPACFRESTKGFLTFFIDKDNTYDKICQLAYDDIRGTNFFDNTFLTGKNAIGTPLALYKANPPLDDAKQADDSRPGIYCVGADEIPFLTTTGQADRVIPGEVGIVDEGSITGTNLASIFAMVIWKDGHISHYFAGDAAWDMENAVAGWSKTTGDPTKAGGAITSMKLSHHGARNSTPTYMLHLYMPKNVIVSCGGRHGHPSWEIMVYLEALYDATQVRKDNLRHIYSTNYPGWLAKSWPDGKYCNVGKVSSKALGPKRTAKMEIFVQSLQSLYTTINLSLNVGGSTVQDIFKEWAKLPQPNKLDKKQWICARMDTHWGIVSSTGPAQMPAIGAAWDGAMMQPNNANKYLRYIKVKSRVFGSPHEGGVKLQYNGAIDEVAPTPRVEYTGPKMTSANKKSSQNDMSSKAQFPADHNYSTRLNVKRGFDTGRIVDPNEDDPTPEKKKKADTDSDIENASSDSAEIKPENDINATNPAASTNNTASTAGEGDDDDPTYYMYGTDFTGTSRSSTATTLAGGTALDGFVNLLHRCVIGFASQPPSTGPSTTTFGDFDEWYCWLQDSIQATVLTAYAPGAAVTIDIFTITMASPLDTVAQPPPATPNTPLRFSTHYAASALAVTLEGDIPGYVPDAALMVFGLDPASFPLATPPTMLDMTLKQVFQYCGPSNMVDSPVMLLLGTVNLQLDVANSGGKRNAVWFDPTNNYRTVIRLQFEMTPAELATFMGYFKDALPALDLDSVTVIAKRTSFWALSCDGALVKTEGDVTLIADWTYDQIKFHIALEFSENLLKLEITTDKDNALNSIIAWLGEKFTDLDMGFLSTWLTSADPNAMPNLRRLTLTIGIPDQGPPTVTNFTMDVEVPLRFGKVSGATVVFLVSVNWVMGLGMDGGELKGSLWCTSPLPPATLTALPDYEPHLQFAPITPGTLSEGLNLMSLFDNSSDFKWIPEVIPPTVVQVYITLTDKKISFGGMLLGNAPKAAPSLSPATLNLDASWDWSTKTATFECDVGILLMPSDDTTEAYNVPSSLRGRLAYKDEGWMVNASAQNLYVSALYAFFDDGAQKGGVMSFLERIEIEYLDLTYTYQSGDKSYFTFSGNILVGELELKLKYDYKSGGDWTFSAELDTHASKGKTATVGTIVESIVGGAASDMPNFISSIPVSDNDSIEFSCANTADDGPILYSGKITIDKFQLDYVQYRKNGWPATTSPKRIIKATVSGLGKFDLPIVGEIDQPFDEMYYLWVGDTNSNEKTGPGLWQEEVDAINTLLAKKDKLLVKALSSKPPGKEDLVIAAGSHFVVVKDEKGKLSAVIDYVFGQPAQKETESTDMVIAGRATTLREGEDEGGDSTGGDSGPSMAAYKKTIGPLSITNIGFQLKGETLSVLLDATFALGPLSLTLLGFGVGLDFSGGATLNNPPKVIPSLSGMAVSFNQSPIEISGLFERKSTDEGELYVGGVIIAFKPYLFEAAGFYGKLILDPLHHPGEEEIAACVFGLLNGPLVELEFAEISGITGGFGYNSALRFPSVSEVESFPFINMNGAPKDPMTALMNMMGGSDAWFTTMDTSYWVAAGLKVTAFETLVIDAVVVVEWNPSISLGIFGVVAADIPADPNIKEKFARVELGIAATVDFAAGLMKFEGQLMPSSFVLSKDCHLTGGFALYSWFAGSDPSMEGDWVFTIGGYNKLFKAPPQYPNPPRLAISWNLDDSLSITGEAYFAMTPKVCMGGGLLHAALSLGPLEAFFDAYADFLINYKPFHFIADAGISVGVRYTMDLWLVTLHISVEIGAHIYLEGPPVSGRVHVDFWVFGFNINFGPGADPVVAVDLAGFYSLVSQASIEPSAAAVAAVMGTDPAVEKSGEEKDTIQKDHILSCQSGQIPSTNGTSIPGVNDAWLVRAATFSFGIACRMAIDTVEIEGDSGTPVPKPPNPIYAKPMQLTEPNVLTSDLKVKIESDPPAPLPNLWRVAPTLKAVPSALWGVYDPNQDPSNPSANNLNNLLSGGSGAISLMMGVIITAPIPTASEDQIPPFDAKLESSLTIEPGGTFPDVDGESADWLPIPGTGGDDQWDLVKAKWQDPLSGQGSAQAMVKEWGMLFGWDTNPLVGDPPATLLDGFGVWYMDAPLLGVESTTGKSAQEVMV